MIPVSSRRHPRPATPAALAARRRKILGTLAALPAVGALAVFDTATAQPAWPARAVKFLVPSPPGGPADLFARLFADHCTATFGKPFVVENRPGATGSLASQALVRSPADGYTFLIGSNSTFVLTPLLQKNPGYDPLRDYAPVGLFMSYPALLLRRPDAPFGDIAGLIAHAKAHPGKLNYASFGIGSLGHLVNEHLCQLAGIKVEHINYPGTAAVLQALAKGEADYAFDSYGNARALIDSGRVVPLAVSAARRDRRLPQVPSIAEAGFAQIDVRIWLGWVAPAGTPADIVDRLQAELARFVELADTRQRFETAAIDVQLEPAAAMAERLAAERRLWSAVIRDARIVTE